MRVTAHTKPKAKEKAKSLQKKGHRTRIVYNKTNGRYEIYSRGDRKKKVK